MCRFCWCMIIVCLTIWAFPQPNVGRAQDNQDFQITPELFDLPEGNVRKAGPSEPRVYHAREDGVTPDRSKRPIWMGETPTHPIQAGEVTAYHNAVDITSKGEDGRPTPLPFKAGVYGTVVISKPGFIAVQLPDGNIIQYLHVSKGFLKFGQEVKPDTPLGVTGNLNSKGKPDAKIPIHLHVQVTNPQGKILNPDLAFLAGRNEKQDRTIKWTTPKWVDAGPLVIDTKRPPTMDGVVSYEASKRYYYDEKAPKAAAEVNARPQKKEEKRGISQVRMGREAFLRDMAAFNRDASAAQKDLADLKRDINQYEGDRQALIRDGEALDRDTEAFNALPSSQQTRAEFDRITGWKDRFNADNAALKPRKADLNKRLAELKERQAAMERRRAALDARAAALTKGEQGDNYNN